MMQLLVSVSNIDEAKIALDNAVDIIDLKHPGRGALGALDTEVLAEIIQFVRSYESHKNKLITATIGDLPMQPDLLLKHTAHVAACGVDVIKIGFFNGLHVSIETYRACLEQLQKLTKQNHKLVAVLFAEYTYPSEIIAMIKSAGFYGVMLDTAHKNGATFLDYFSDAQMLEIAGKIKKQHLHFGLAGSLQLQHIVQARQFGPSYIGFRGGLCDNNQRMNLINAGKVKLARELMSGLL